MLCITKKIVTLKAKLLSGSTIYSGFTSSICEDGLFIITLPLGSDPNISSGSVVQVKLDPPGKESVCLNCRVKWVYKTPPHKLTNSVGMEILDALPDYKELLTELL